MKEKIIFNEKIDIPDIVNDKCNMAYEQIRSEAKMPVRKIHHRKKITVTAIILAATLACGVPVAASYFKSAFSVMNQEVYIKSPDQKADLSAYAQNVNENSAQLCADITMQSVYCDGENLSIAFALKPANEQLKGMTKISAYIITKLNDTRLRDIEGIQSAVPVYFYLSDDGIFYGTATYQHLSVHTKIVSLREEILYEIAFIESALDDPEHISLDEYPENLLPKVQNMNMELNKLLSTCDNGRIMKEGIQTVIVGKPNAGKSSLMNVLVGEERAIVTDIAGTTRDIIEEHISLNGVSLNVIDTAGIRNTDDIVENIGVSKAKEYAEKSDLILYVVDGTKEMDEADEEIWPILENKKVIILLNKSDLDNILTKEELEEKFHFPVIPISAKEETGINILEDTLKEMFFHGELSFNDEIYITNMRHKEAIQNAYNSMQLVEGSILDGMPEDFFSIDLMNAYKSLGIVIGEEIEDDLANEIFSKFCMGK